MKIDRIPAAGMNVRMQQGKPAYSHVVTVTGPGKTIYIAGPVAIDIRCGLAPLREKWIEARNDTEVLTGPASAYGKQRLADPNLAEMRFSLKRQPRRARAGANVTQMHYARSGIITPEMEYIALRENQRCEHLSQQQRELLTRHHPGQDFGAILPQHITPEFVRDEVAGDAPSSPRISIIRNPNR